jgi:hypothetical protein
MRLENCLCHYNLSYSYFFVYLMYGIVCDSDKFSFFKFFSASTKSFKPTELFGSLVVSSKNFLTSGDWIQKAYNLVMLILCFYEKSCFSHKTISDSLAFAFLFRTLKVALHIHSVKYYRSTNETFLI